jgi:hypothetical protein
MLVTAGFPPVATDIFIDTYQGISDGQLAETTGDLRLLIGRPTTTLEQSLTDIVTAQPARTAAQQSSRQWRLTQEATDPVGGQDTTSATHRRSLTCNHVAEGVAVEVGFELSKGHVWPCQLMSCRTA